MKWLWTSLAVAVLSILALGQQIRLRRLIKDDKTPQIHHGTARQSPRVGQMKALKRDMEPF